MDVLNSFLGKWEPFWLFLILFVEMIAGMYTAYVVTIEYRYDEAKDIEKKQRRTRTTKKTTRNPGGVETTEESSEVLESLGETNEEKKA